LLFVLVALLGATLSAWLGEETMQKPLQQDPLSDIV
jgi:hypothetical protein